MPTTVRLMDVCTQTNIVIHKYFVPYINRKFSIKPMSKMFGAAFIRDWKKQMEPLCKVHSLCMEQSHRSPIKWQPE